MPKRKVFFLSASDKLKLIREVESGKSVAEVSRAANVPISTLYRIVNKDKSKVESECATGQGKQKRVSTGEFPQLEKCLVEWMKDRRAENIPLSGTLIKQKGRSFAAQLDITDFNGSNGWLEGFKKRYDLVFKKICGESAVVDNDCCNQWISDLPMIIDQYSPDDIFNADETALFFRCIPSATFTFKGDPCHGGKLSKERVTLLLAASMSGKEKLPLLMIGKSKKPRCLRGVRTLPLNYKNNIKAWMTRDIFTDWLRSIDIHMRLNKRKILLFIDNCSAHTHLPQFENIKIIFLPPNTTSRLQPMDQGIIKNFKQLYRTEVVKLILQKIENHETVDITILAAMRLARRAWNDVKSATVANCFKKSGFKTAPGGEKAGGEPDLENVIASEEDWSRVLGDTSASVDLPSFEDYVSIDDEASVSGQSVDEEIVMQITQNAESEEEDDGSSDGKPSPSIQDATKAIETLQLFFEGNQCDPICFDRIHDLEKMILKAKKSRQTKMTDFFQ
nr:tigger transposable element-derived protein 6-like [Halyomorpha halys]